MGGNTPSNSFDDQFMAEAGLERYRKITDTTHELLGPISLFQDSKTLEHWIVAKRIVSQDSDVAALLNAELARYSTISQSPGAARLYAFRCNRELEIDKPDSSLCSVIHVVDMIFEYNQITLEILTAKRKDILTRTRASGGCYSEQELWSILIQATDTIRAYLNAGVHPIQDLQPSMVLVMNGHLDNQVPKIKLLDSQFFFEER